MYTYHPLVGVGELVHEKVNSPKAKSLAARGEHSLELLVVDDSIAILVNPVEALNHLGVGARGEGRGGDLAEWVSPKHSHGLVVVGFVRRGLVHLLLVRPPNRSW